MTHERSSAAGETANQTGGLSGQTLGDYRLGALLGAGGMAEVYRALDLALDREVAVKVLPAPLASDAGYVARFREEARRVAALHHPHIVPIYAFGEERGLLYHVMPVVPETLRDRLKRQGRLAPAEAVYLVLQVASALEAAHAVGLVHRDVKPENMLLTAEGNALLTDFGIARDLASLRKTGTTRTLAATGLPVGTPEYMAPEQLRGDSVDQRADVYALGTVLYELLTGTVPFEDESPYSVAVLVLTASLPPPSTLNPHLWPALEHAVLTALARDADARYPDMQRFARALREALDQPHTFAQADTTGPVRPLDAMDAMALGPRGQATPPDRLWSATTWLRGAGAAPERRLPWSPSWRTHALRAGLVLLLLGVLAAGGALVVRGGAPSPSRSGSRPAAAVTSGPVATMTQTKPAATTTATATTATATTATTTAATATATATATPAPTLTLAPTPLVLTPKVQNTCAATQTITNNTGQTVGWTWQPPTQGGMHFQVNNQPPVGWPSDTSPGIAPGGHDTLVATADCKSTTQSFAVLMTTTVGDQYTFIVQVQ